MAQSAEQPRKLSGPVPDGLRQGLIKYLGKNGLIAQSVEQRPFKALVLGSSPSQPTSLKRCPFTAVTFPRRAGRVPQFYSRLEAVLDFEGPPDQRNPAPIAKTEPPVLKGRAFLELD